MIKPERMARVLILGPISKKDAVIERLQEMRLLHVRDFRDEDEALKAGTPREFVERDSDILLKLRLASSKARLGPSKNDGIRLDEATLEDEIHSDNGHLRRTIDHVLRLSEEIVIARSKVQVLNDRIAFLQEVQDIGLDMEDLDRFGSISLVMGSMERRLDRTLRSSFPGILVRRPPKWRSETVAIFVPSGDLKALREFLSNSRFTELRIPDLPRPPRIKSAADLIGSYSSEISRLGSEIDKAESRIQSEMSKDRVRFLAAEEFLTMKVQREELAPRIAEGKVSFAIDGWVPHGRLKQLDRLRTDLGGDIAIVETKDDKDDAPTLLNNPRPVKDFELFTRMYSPPKEGEIDPTAILTISFPLFFGFIVGDMGIGLMMAGFALFLRKYKFIGIGGRDLSNVLLIAAASSFLWGIVFGEVFGIPLAHEEGFDYSIQGLFGIHLPYHGLISKIGDVKVLMLGSIVAGYVHLLLGLGIGAYNESHHSMKRAVLGKGGWMLILTGFFMIIFLVLSGIRTPFNAAFVALPCLFIGVASLIAGEGVLTVLEVLSIFTNTLSYVRLFAVGLAKAGIAIAADSITLKIVTGDLWPIGLLLFISAHFGLMLLAILSAGLHSIRLNYVEFFSKFYEGGGSPFSPFGSIRRLTKKGERDGN
jgi:V/A-type H+-transporting ATPase subunit I